MRAGAVLSSGGGELLLDEEDGVLDEGGGVDGGGEDRLGRGEEQGDEFFDGKGVGEGEFEALGEVLADGFEYSDE